MRILLLISLLILSGCANDERFDRNPSFTNRSFIVMKHPGTKDFKECHIDPNEPNPFRMYETMDKCKEEYEDKGYKVFTQH